MTLSDRIRNSSGDRGLTAFRSFFVSFLPSFVRFAGGAGGAGVEVDAARRSASISRSIGAFDPDAPSKSK